MTSKRTQIRVGIFTLVAIALAAVVLFVFAGVHLFSHRDHYYVVFDDSVMGLEKGAQVYVNGIQVGSVESVGIAPRDLGKVQVDIAVSSDTPVHADSRAFLSLAGITGLKVIDIKSGSYGSPALAPGDTIPAGIGTFDKLQAQAEKLADETTTIIARAQMIADSADHVMANLKSVTDPAALGDIVAATRRTSANLADASESIKGMAIDDRKAIDHLVNKQLVTLMTNANDLVVDLRGVVHSNEASLASTMADVRQASKSFKDLAREVREKPSRLLFSQAQQERKLP